MFDSRPLAERMRPVRLVDYISQSHLVGEKGALRMQIEKGITPSSFGDPLAQERLLWPISLLRRANVLFSP